MRNAAKWKNGTRRIWNRGHRESCARRTSAAENWCSGGFQQNLRPGRAAVLCWQWPFQCGFGYVATGAVFVDGTHIKVKTNLKKTVSQVISIRIWKGQYIFELCWDKMEIHAMEESACKRKSRAIPYATSEWSACNISSGLFDKNMIFCQLERY